MPGLTESMQQRAGQNRTITLNDEERKSYRKRILRPASPLSAHDCLDRTIQMDLFDALELLPDAFVDLLFIDPPYNMPKSFNGRSFGAKSDEAYEEWVEAFIQPMLRLLKPHASVYVCGDWKSSSSLYRVLKKHFIVRNRITWEREKGRGARWNWKNASEDIWFATRSKRYTFNVEAVKRKKPVIAPYRENGEPKGWRKEKKGNFRLTHPSNLWTDITVPFWSMPENTDHPTQKPEKLLAKIILASSEKGDTVFDPFLGVGTSSVVAKKLGRHYCGVEQDEYYACLAEKRLDMAEKESRIQGYREGVFRDRNEG